MVCLCVKRKKGHSHRTTFQQIVLAQSSNVMQEGHGDNIANYDVIPDDITEREATPYTSLQMTEKHLYTALAGPSFMSTERSYVIGRIADSAVPVDAQFQMNERQETNNEEPESDGPGDLNYDDVEVSEKRRNLGRRNTESEANTSYCFVK
ncbi:hypothetical protein DPMN_077090 [Dreissena polymorpha]|uniref:Uncharacterized protein n=2 Tax=Dreissena polymorpha TaxID=45954 RepID=A0A9D3YPX2_DREPO|nr:hypothetical protein DPMN_077090 [Dreissena polymorpha]